MLAVGSLSLAVTAVLPHLAVKSHTYATTLYAGFPRAFWVAFATTVGIGTWIAVTANGHRFRSHGFVLVGSAYSVFFFLPHYLGLRFWAPPRGDLLAHFGDVSHILDTGHTAAQNIYPLLHVLVSQVVLATGVPMETLQALTGLLFFALLVLGVRSYARVLFRDRETALVVAATALPLVYAKYNHHLFPWMAGFALIPVTLFLVEYHRRQNPFAPGASRRSLVGTVLLLEVAMVLYHPMSSVVFVVMLLTMAASTRLASRRYDVASWTPRLGWVLVPALVHTFWYTSFRSFVQFHVERLLSVVLTESPVGATRIDRAAGSGYTAVQLLIRFVVLDYGPLLIFLGTGLVVALFVTRRVLAGTPRRADVVVLGFFVLGLLLAVGLLSSSFLDNPYRVNQVTILAATVLVGYGIAERPFGGVERSKHLATVLALGVVIAGVTAPFVVFGERYHVVETEFEGADWHLEYRNSTTDTRSMAMSHQLSVYLVGPSDAGRMGRQRWAFHWQNPEYSVPSRLGYEGNGPGIGSVVTEPAYVVTKRRDVRLSELEPENRLAEVRYYTRSDVERLRDEPDVHRLYANGEFTIWRVD